MMPLGHLGIGYKISEFLDNKNLARSHWKWTLFGALAPDLIDKTLFYGIRYAQLPFSIISGTRTFGHTFLFLVMMFLIAKMSKSSKIYFFTVGILTHLFVDHLGNFIMSHFYPDAIQEMALGISFFSSPAIVGLFWPVLGTSFPVYPFEGIGQHAKTLFLPHVWGGELLGLYYLMRAKLWKRAYSPP